MFNVQIDFEALRDRLYDVVDAIVETADEAVEFVNEQAERLYDL